MTHICIFSLSGPLQSAVYLDHNISKYIYYILCIQTYIHTQHSLSKLKLHIWVRVVCIPCNILSLCVHNISLIHQYFTCISLIMFIHILFDSYFLSIHIFAIQFNYYSNFKSYIKSSPKSSIGVSTGEILNLMVLSNNYNIYNMQ